MKIIGKDEVPPNQIPVGDICLCAYFSANTYFLSYVSLPDSRFTKQELQACNLFFIPLFWSKLKVLAFFVLVVLNESILLLLAFDLGQMQDLKEISLHIILMFLIILFYTLTQISSNNSNENPDNDPGTFNLNNTVNQPGRHTPIIRKVSQGRMFVFVILIVGKLN